MNECLMCGCCIPEGRQVCTRCMSLATDRVLMRKEVAQRLGIRQKKAAKFLLEYGNTFPNGQHYIRNSELEKLILSGAVDKWKRQGTTTVEANDERFYEE